MRKLTALAAAAAIVVLAACSSQQAKTDPYQVVDDATHASYGTLVQLSIGVDGTSAGQSVHIDPSAIRLVLDTKAGKVDVALALPLDSLQIDAATRAQLGLTGNALDLEVLYDGTALYAKGQVLQPLLTALLMQTGGTPGDYSGWLRLGTAQELGGLVGGLVPQMSLLPAASPSAAASYNAATLKTNFEKAGINLTYVGREQRGGQQVDHLTATIDATKLEGSPLATEVPAAQMTQVRDALAQVDIAPDLWFAADSHRLTEVDLKLTPKAGAASPAASGTGPVSIKLLVSTPADDSALQAPSNATDVNLAPIIQSLLKSFGQGLFNLP
jgi:hypothetical protein